MNNYFLSILVSGSLALFVAPQAQAISMVFSPSSQTVSLGQFLTVDIFANLSGGEIVSAYDLNISFNPSVMEETGTVFGTMLGGGTGDSLQSASISNGLVDLSEVSLLLDTGLASLQQPPSTFLLATLQFTDISLGTSPLQFVNYGNPGIDIKGINNTPYSQPSLGMVSIVSSGSVTVPEPATLVLLVAGMVGIKLGKRVMNIKV